MSKTSEWLYGGSSKGSSSSSSSNSSSKHKMSASTYEAYNNAYENYKKTGDSSSSLWNDRDTVNAWTNMRNGKVKYTRVGDTYYYMDNDTYNKYDTDYKYYKKSGKNNSSLWSNADASDAYRYITDERNGNGAYNNLKWTIDNTDPEVIENVRKKYKSQWGDKYYYDTTDPEDLYRQANGLMPKYLEGKYDLGDAYSKFLYDNNLPYNITGTNGFSDMYSEAYNDWKAQEDYKTNYNNFLKETASKIHNATEEEIAPVVSEILTSGNYDGVAKNFRKKSTEGDEWDDIITNYVKEEKSGNKFDIDDIIRDIAQYMNVPKAQAEQVVAQAIDDGTVEEVAEVVKNTKAPTSKQEKITDIDERIKEIDRQIYQMSEYATKDELDALKREKAELQNAKGVEVEQNIAETLVRSDFDANNQNGKGVSTDGWDIADKMLFRDVNGIVYTPDQADGGSIDSLKDVGEWTAENFTGFVQNALRYVENTDDSSYWNALSPTQKASTFMTEEEKAIYNNIAKTSGGKKATEYFDYIRGDLYDRMYAEEKKENADYLGTKQGNSWFVGLVQGAADLPESTLGGYSMLFDDKVYVNDPRAKATRRTSALRENVTKDMDSVGKFFTETAYSVADNGFRMLTMGKAGLGVMAGEVYASKTNELMNNGCTSDQAKAGAFAAAMIEVATEYVSLENFMNMAKAGKESAKPFIKSLLSQMGCEASEEAASEILNLFTYAVNAEGENQFQTMIKGYMDEGYSGAEARGKAFIDAVSQTFASALGGAVSGMFFGGIGGVANVGSYKAQNEYNLAAETNGQLNSIVNEQVKEDLEICGLPTESKSVFNEYREQPTDWVTEEGKAKFKDASDKLHETANGLRTIQAEDNSDKLEASIRLSKYMDALTTARQNYQAAYEANDVAGMRASIQQENSALNDYINQSKIEESKLNAKRSKRTERSEKLKTDLNDVFNTLSGNVANDIAYQEEIANTIDSQDKIAQAEADLTQNVVEEIQASNEQSIEAEESMPEVETIENSTVLEPNNGILEAETVEDNNQVKEEVNNAIPDNREGRNADSETIETGRTGEEPTDRNISTEVQQEELSRVNNGFHPFNEYEPEYEQEVIGRTRTVLGKPADNVCMYTRDENIPKDINGFAVNGRSYVEYTGNKTDIGFVWHEIAHNSKGIRNGILEAIKGTGNYDGILESYRGATTDLNVEAKTNAEIEEELLCDAFGAYALYRTVDASIEDVSGVLGMSDAETESVFDAISEMLANGIEEDEEFDKDNAIKYSSVEYSANDLLRQYREAETPETREGIQGIAQEKIRSTEKSIADKLVRDISEKWNISYRSVNSESSEVRKSVHEFVENFVDGDLESASKSAENIVERIVNDITDKGYSQKALNMVGDEETADFLANEIKNTTFAITYHDGEKTVGKSIREESKGLKWRKNGGVYLYDWWASMRSKHPGLPDMDEESLAPFLSDFYRAYKEDRISLEQAYANEGGYGEIKDIIKEEILPILADWENKHMTEMSIANGTASTDEQLEFEKQNAKRSQLQEDAARRFDRKQEILKKADDATFKMMQKLSGSKNQNEAINGGLLELQRAGADKEVINQVRGNLLRNGYGVGGLRSDKAMEPISKNMKFFKKIGKLIVKSPARVLREFAQYADTNVKGIEEFSRNVCLNMRASDEMESNYFMYQQNHLMEQNLFKKAKSTEVADIGANDSESILAQLLGEELITEDEAKNAVTDGKYTLIPKGTGAMILKNKNGRIHMMADGESVLSYTDNVVKSLIERQKAINEIRNDGKPNSAERIAELKKTGIGSVANTVTNKLEQDGNTYKIVNADGDVLFEMQSKESAFSDKTLKLRDTLKSIYDEMYEMANETLLVNGYGGLNKRSNYMPHFTSSDTGLNGFIQFMHSEDLPVSIAGITGEFSPGKPWNGHMLERIGDETDYHAINGFNNYLGGVSNVIFQTPVIQRYRQLENLIRTGKSSKTGEQYSTNQELSGFVSWLHDYTNLLANKKSAMDRTVESWIGRKAYTLPGKITGTIGAAQIGMNINSALTNAAAMFEGAGKVKPKNFGKAVADTISAMANGSIDDFNDKCAFLVNRQSKEEETITNLGGKVRAKGEKVLFGLSEAVDDFSTNIIARAKYYELIEEGYGEEAALNKTTMFCNDLFAERSKGSKPSIFESRVIAPIVQYQIEPLNMLWHASDVHKENMYSEYRRILKQNNGVLQGIDFGSAENQISKAGIANKDIRKFLGMIIGLSAYGMIKRLLTGRDATWNPLGIVLDTVNGAKDDGFGGAVSALGDAVKENAPFGSAIESVANMFTGNDSSSASIPVPALSAISSAVNDIKKGDIFGLVATFAPGGGQVRKTKNGLQAVAEGGKYTSDGRLQYPVDKNGFNYAKGVLFGTTALQPYGYDYYSDTLNEKETELYEEAVSKGLDKQTVYDYLLNGYDKNATVDDSTKKASLLVSDLEEDEQKLMAEVLGIKWTNEEDTKKELESFKEETEKKHNKVKKDGSTQIGDDTYNKRMSAIDYYMEMLS